MCECDVNVVLNVVSDVEFVIVCVMVLKKLV